MTDSLGDTIWSRGYRPAANVIADANSVVVNVGGGYTAAGWLAKGTFPHTVCGYVLKVSDSGDSFWASRLGCSPNRETFVEDIVQTNDGGFLAVGESYWTR